MASSSSSVPIARSGWTYDVFLSFRGEDTRNTFVDHLYAALVQKGIHTFKDNVMLGGGEQISSALLNAIQESRFAVVVLSKNYANSSWCLEELAKIMDCHHQMGQKVLPVFYHVDPSDVRGQKKDFETALKQHEEGKFKGEIDKVNKWREALTTAANLSGYPISAFSGGEAAIVNDIVEMISADNPARRRENNLIGIESHMKKLISKLNLEDAGEVRTIGILGMGGIGKTTIARVLFRRISYKFVGSSFVNDVRENSSTKKDICALQEKILTDILGAHHGSIIQDPVNGADKIQERLGNKKVLLVLDDVDDFKQLEFLAESNKWFGSGSRIIITTRNEQLLSDADTKYKPALLTEDQALELFSRHAFRGSNPPDGYKDLSDRAIRYTGRLPLALKVLGAFFRGRQASVWESALDKLPKIRNKEIFDTLELSFKHLDPDEKQIFLDIACFFKGEKVEDVTRVLDSFGFHTKIGISVLVEKSLITVSNKTLGMHDLIQEMGRKIASERFSRLWLIDVIHDLIKKSRELHAIEAIGVPSIFPGPGLPVDVFENMKNLRLLEVYFKFTCGEPTSLPDELRWFRWFWYPFASLPVADMSKLVGLELRSSKIKYLWHGQKSMSNLRIINLEYSDSLIRFPDVSGAPNVESLSLSRCVNLEEVDGSLGSLSRLSYLNMSYCRKLKCLPSRLEMESLETLILLGCVSLERFPELSPCMVKLYELDLSHCSKIEELPSSIEYLCNLRFLNLSRTSLMYIPHSLCELKCLTSLDLASCHKLQNLSDEFGRMEKLQELHLNNLPVASVSFHVLNNLCSLRKLDLSGSQIRDKDFPEDLNGFFLLEELLLRGNNRLLELPASITHLTRLKNLDITACTELQIVHGLPSGIQVLNASYCRSLRKIENLSEGYEWLNNIFLYNCKRLLEDAEFQRFLDKMLKETFLTKYVAVDSCVSIGVPGDMIPSWFKEQQDGDKIALKLPPNWQTQIMGLAISAVISEGQIYNGPDIDLRFEDDGLLVKTDIDFINVCSGSEKRNLWVGYVPFSLFDVLLVKTDIDGEDWSHVFGHNLLINIHHPFGKKAILRCGAKVVYKEEVESTQQTKPSIPPFYWNWKLSQTSPNTFQCEDIVFSGFIKGVKGNGRDETKKNCVLKI